MAVPTSFSDLSTTAASNSPSGSETPAEGDNHFRITYAFLRSILDNSGNGWVSPYWALTATGPSISATTVTWSGNPTHSGNHTFSGNVTVQGNTTLGNAGTDTVTTNGNVTMNAPTTSPTLALAATGSAGVALSASGSAATTTIITSQTGTTTAAAYHKISNTGGNYFFGVDSSAGGSLLTGATYALCLVTESARDIYFGTNNTTRVVITSDGRLYGTALHNNAGAVTGTTTQYIASGTYTPSVLNNTNTSARTAFASQWIRVGNVVTVSGQVSITPTAAASTQTAVSISLPIASNFTAQEHCAGAASDGGNTTQNGAAAMLADTTNDVALLLFNAATTNANTWRYTFTYVVL